MLTSRVREATGMDARLARFALIAVLRRAVVAGIVPGGAAGSFPVENW